jgi:hypothetical protein
MQKLEPVDYKRPEASAEEPPQDDTPHPAVTEELTDDDIPF